MAALIAEPNASLSMLGDRASRSTHARTCCRGARGVSRSVRQPLCRFRFIAAAARGSRGGTLCAVRRRIVNGDDGCVLFFRRCRAEPVHAACCMLHVACCTLQAYAARHVVWRYISCVGCCLQSRAARGHAQFSRANRWHGWGTGPSTVVLLAAVSIASSCALVVLLRRCASDGHAVLHCCTLRRRICHTSTSLSVRGSAVGCDGRLLDCSSRSFSPCDRYPHRPLPCSLFNRLHCALPWAGWVGSTVRSLSTAR